MAPPTPTPPPTLYFGYGSNLWLHQMRTRCPTSTYQGVARLSNYRWIINDRGYANVVRIPSSTTSKHATARHTSYPTIVFGLVYTLSPADEKRLDRNEGVPIAYTKELLDVDFWKADNGAKIDVFQPPTSTQKMLVYIDRKRVTEDEPMEEYIYRMNKGIDDALAMGVPRKYVDQVMRKFIPEGEEDSEERKEVEAKALSQATEFVDESGVMLNGSEKVG